RRVAPGPAAAQVGVRVRQARAVAAALRGARLERRHVRHVHELVRRLHPGHGQEAVAAPHRHRPPATAARRRLEAGEAPARRDRRRRVVAVAVGAAVAVAAAPGGPLLEHRPRRRGGAPPLELVLAGVGERVPGVRRAGGDGELDGDLVVAAEDGEVVDGGAVRLVLAVHHVARPRPVPHHRPRPVPHEHLQERVRVAAVREAPRRRVAGAPPRHQPVGGARRVHHPQLHPGQERVGRVLEALPQGGAVRRPDDEVTGVHQHRGRVAVAGAGGATGDVGRPADAAVGVGHDEVGGVGQGQGRAICDRGFLVGDPDHGAHRDVVVPYAEVELGRGGVGGGEEAHGEGAAVGDDGGIRG
ncbi:Os09g0551550, partial [Oryza sativa Japonica Group]